MPAYLTPQILFLFICVLTQQPKCQLQSEHEWWNKQLIESRKYANYNIWVMII
jgi:predicted metal-binding protein